MSGADLAADFDYANLLLQRIRHVPGVADARIQQSPANPTLNVDVDRTRAQYVGLTERDVTNSLVVNLAGSGQVTPTYWLDPEERRLLFDRHADAAIPARHLERAADDPDLGRGRRDLADPGRPRQDHANGRQCGRLPVQHPADRADLRDAARTRSRRGRRTTSANSFTKPREASPRAATVAMLGQVQTMNSAYSGLLFGLIAAIVLIYLLIVVNFQSWADPFVIVTALPAGLAGIVWMLFVSQTTLSVPALTGAIMCMGIATANSVLVISFARERFAALGDPIAAALEAGFVRFRPVVMTALAMMIGMAPMALGLGEGGEQNAPLGRAVVGGLIFATVATLIFVPVVFSLAHKRGPKTNLQPSGSQQHA